MEAALQCNGANLPKNEYLITKVRRKLGVFSLMTIKSSCQFCKVRKPGFIWADPLYVVKKGTTMDVYIYPISQTPVP